MGSIITNGLYKASEHMCGGLPLFFAFTKALLAKECVLRSQGILDIMFCVYEARASDQMDIRENR